MIATLVTLLATAAAQPGADSVLLDLPETYPSGIYYYSSQTDKPELWQSDFAMLKDAGVRVLLTYVSASLLADAVEEPSEAGTTYAAFLEAAAAADLEVVPCLGHKEEHMLDPEHRAEVIATMRGVARFCRDHRAVKMLYIDDEPIRYAKELEDWQPHAAEFTARFGLPFPESTRPYTESLYLLRRWQGEEYVRLAADIRRAVQEEAPHLGITVVHMFSGVGGSKTNPVPFVALNGQLDCLLVDYYPGWAHDAIMRTYAPGLVCCFARSLSDFPVWYVPQGHIVTPGYYPSSYEMRRWVEQALQQGCPITWFQVDYWQRGLFQRAGAVMRGDPHRFSVMMEANRAAAQMRRPDFPPADVQVVIPTLSFWLRGKRAELHAYATLWHGLQQYFDFVTDEALELRTRRLHAKLLIAADPLYCSEGLYRAVTEAVRAGATLICTGGAFESGDDMQLTPARQEEMLGARVSTEETRTEGVVEIGRNWLRGPVAEDALPLPPDSRAIEALDATVLATTDAGEPFILQHELGQGEVLYCPADMFGLALEHEGWRALVRALVDRAAPENYAAPFEVRLPPLSRLGPGAVYISRDQDLKPDMTRVRQIAEALTGAGTDRLDEQEVLAGELDHYDWVISLRAIQIPAPVRERLTDFVRRGGDLLSVGEPALCYDGQLAALYGLTSAASTRVIEAESFEGLGRYPEQWAPSRVSYMALGSGSGGQGIAGWSHPETSAHRQIPVPQPGEYNLWVRACDESDKNRAFRVKAESDTGGNLEAVLCDGSQAPSEEPTLLWLRVGQIAAERSVTVSFDREGVGANDAGIDAVVLTSSGEPNHTIRLTSAVGELPAGTVLEVSETWLAFAASEGTRVLGVFEDGSPALVERDLGEGRCAALLVAPQERLTEGDQAETWQKLLDAFLPAARDADAD